MAGKGQQLEWNSKAYGQTSKTTNEWYQPSNVTTVQGNQPNVCESTTRIRHEDKQSGSYERCTMKEKVSSGDVYVEKQTGQVGIQDEHTMKSTLKIGDKSGFTEYYNEQRVRQVDFGNEYSSKNTIDDYHGNEYATNNTIDYYLDNTIDYYHGNEYATNNTIDYYHGNEYATNNTIDYYHGNDDYYQSDDEY